MNDAIKECSFINQKMFWNCIGIFIVFAQRNTSDPKGVSTGICIHMQKECCLQIQCCISLESQKKISFYIFPRGSFIEQNLPFWLLGSSPACMLSCLATWEKTTTCDLAGECDLRPTGQCNLRPTGRRNLRPTATELWRWARNWEVRSIYLLPFEEVLLGLIFCCNGRN